MAYFAEIDKNSIVKRVIVASQKFIDSKVVGNPKDWIETFIDGGIRKNYASVGYTYDKVLDIFIPPQTFPSWIFDVTTCTWKAPVDKPDDGKMYVWDEKELKWVN